MTSAEHSTLVFLLQAIEATPAKSRELLNLAERHQRSEGFRDAVSSLRSVEGDERALLERSETMRRALRKP